MEHLKKCLNCEKNFYVKRKVAFFCSVKCKNIGKPKTLLRICKSCNKEFYYSLTYPKKLFCGKSCITNFYKEQYKKGFVNGELGNFLKLRFEVFKRDSFKCVYCGRTPKEDNVKLQVEHKKPKSKGGKFNINNLVASCQECNLGKFDVLLNERQKDNRLNPQG